MLYDIQYVLSVLSSTIVDADQSIICFNFSHSHSFQLDYSNSSGLTQNILSCLQLLQLLNTTMLNKKITYILSLLLITFISQTILFMILFSNLYLL